MPVQVAVNVSLAMAAIASATPSLTLRTKLPLKPSHTTTSTFPEKTSRPST